MSEQEVIDAGRRVEQFLADPAITDALEGLERAYLEELITAPSDQLHHVRTKVTVLRDFATSLRGVVDRGKRAGIERARAARM